MVVPPAPVETFDQFVPSLLTCHWTVGVGLPVAAAVKVAVWPLFTVWLVGCELMDGAKFTVTVAALVATLAVTLLLYKARY